VLEPPDLAVDAHGNAVAVWLSTRSVLPRYSYRRYMNTADYDTAAPELSALQVPVSGRPGVRLRFSATPVDSWSGVASTRWRFGDGATAAGRAASHVYKRSGTFRVTVIATDRAGHSTSSTRTLRIR
jgi:PKD repeat protein